MTYYSVFVDKLMYVVRDGGNSAVHHDDPVEGFDRFEVLIDLTEEPSDRPVYTEAEVEARLAPLGVFTRDVSPVIDWNTEIVGVPTLSTEESVNGMLNSCGLANFGITFIIPRPADRPCNPPRDYICLYEAYFRQCHMWFPIPTLLISFIHHRHLAILQLTPAAICNFVGALTFGAEGGYQVNLRCFEEMTMLKAGRSPGTWVVNNRPNHKFMPGDKVSNFKSWERHYFFVRSDIKSSEAPARHKPSREFPAKYEEVRSAIFRVQNRTWKGVTKERVARIMGRVRKSFVSFAARLRGSPLPLAHASEGGPSAQDPINTSVPELPEVNGGSAEDDLVPVETEIAEHTEDRAEAGTLEVVGPTANSQATAPETIQVDFDLTVPESTGDAPPAEETTALGQRTKSREDKGKGVEVSEKRIASEAGLPEDGPPRKTFCWTRDDPDRPDRFSFQYIGDKYLMRDQEAASQLWRNMTLPGEQAISNPDELVCSAEYKKFARSSFETNALANNLVAWYDRKLKLKLADRGHFKQLSSVFEREKSDHEELRKKYARLEVESETHSAEVASLIDEVARLGRREVELAEEVARLGDREIALMGEVAKLEADLAFSRDHKEKELTRLRNDRFAKVSRTTQKAQARLDKVKGYLKEQEDVVQPKMDALNQSKGAQEIATVLISRGAVISEIDLENLAKEAKIAEEEVYALNIIELTNTDLNMSPDQLGFRRARSSAQVTPVPNQHGSNSELVSQSDIRHVTVKEKDPES
ncbi:unnamed protein product [Arabidopsis arenosa]|uniref:Uncharacterized protein n=1 Tax=Arabidopsis arenosa TaxID=38785 RepID=A0A8S2AWG1_ARAAE|nr:unnamed protein product [Arabidopsis arenosa]